MLHANISPPSALPHTATATRSAASVKLGLRHRLYDLLRLNFALFPGIRQARSATFLQPHYAHRAARQGLPRIAFNALVFVAFQTWLPFRTRAVARKWGHDRIWEKRTLQICRSRFVDPNDIALFRIEQAGQLDDYVRRFEHIPLGRAMAHAESDHSALLIDKLHFYQTCNAGNLPHPEVIAYDAAGLLRLDAKPNAGETLFVKPACGSGGRGAIEIELPADGDPVAHLQTIVAGLRQREKGWDKQCWIIQRRLQPHPQLRALCGPVLPTARLITMLDERGRPEIVSTVLRFPARFDAIVDNIGLGGLSAPIDADSGELGAGCAGMRPGEYREHPESGAAIEGCTIPFWPDIRELVERCHANHFSDHVMVGWDVAIADTGPALLEANARPSIILAQRATRKPVGPTRMGQLMAFHLEARRQEGKGRNRIIM